MKLISVVLHGYKRFKERSSMNVDSKLVAVVGPNEAGKTSFLQALTHLDHANEFDSTGASRETTRGVTLPPDQSVVSATYLLDDDDWEALREVHGAQEIRWCTVSKEAESGRRYYTFSQGPERSLQPRQRAVRLLGEVSSRKRFQELAEEYEESDLAAEVESLASTLSTEVQTMPEETPEVIRSVAAMLRDAMSDGGYKYIHELAQVLDDLAEYETGNPVRQTVNILRERRPRFILFSDEQRQLLSEYDLDDVWEEPPAALGNLTQLAGLDLEALHEAVAANDVSEVASMEERANGQLKRQFEVWSQSEVAPRIRIEEQVLKVLIQEPHARFTTIAERSDGLRQFIALLAFAASEPLEQGRILLIDEAETHLHYDAQADLIQMLSKQEIVEKVIYTTHSVGCLPEDLGTGVRLIESQEPESFTSRINNAFWTSNSSGFSPLLFGMGASTLAFVPLRNAVIAEGPSDMILWPKLLREATSRTHLDFQVAPGLSNANRREIIVLNNEAPRTVYLLDSDQGGIELRGKLTGAGIPADKIFLIPDDRGQELVIEDLVAAEVYVQAVNEELRRSVGPDYSFPAGRLPVAGRPTEVETWCGEEGISAPNKTAVAYRVLEKGIGRSILAERYHEPIEQLFRGITSALQG